MNLTRRALSTSLFALGACATSPDAVVRESKLNMFVIEALSRPDRCAVFGSMEHTDMMNLAEPFISFEIREAPADAGGRKIMDISDDMNLAGTWPGAYALQNFYLPANLQTYEFPGWSRGEAGAIGRFDVAGGEVIYIGHLIFRAHGPRVDMQVEDRMDAFSRRLPADILAKLQKRLLSVPPFITFDQQRSIRIR